MKRIKALATTLAAAAAMILLPCTSALTVSAEEPTTYYIQYDSDSGEWRYEINEDGSYGESGYTRELYYYYENVKDGDIVVVSNDDPSAPQLDLGTVRLSNLTILFDTAFSTIKAGSIDDFYALSRSQSSVSAPIANAHVYDPAVANFNDNVQNIIVSVSEDDFTSTVGCGGTVGCLQVNLADQTSYTLYNFRKDTLVIRDGSLQTPEECYSRTPSAAPATQPAASAPSPSSSSDEYDEVPKTGEASPVMWLLCAAAICMVGSCCFRKASK